MTQQYDGRVVVLTGASSGIGRATAVAFAQRGATVVLAARREPMLHEVAEECLSAGGRAMVVPADVTEEEQVQELARRAIAAQGGIDVWINNAGVILFGRFEDCPSDVFERVIRTNLLGTVHGARAVLGHFRERGAGILINNASMVSMVGQPYASAYVASKFAVRGLSEALRQELLDQPDIHVCTVLPASIDTPLFQHAANYTGRAVKPLTPTYPPERVAEVMVHLVERPRREAFAGGAAWLLAAEHALAPSLTERQVARQVEVDLFQDRDAPSSTGNLLRPMADTAGASGGWGHSTVLDVMPHLSTANRAWIGVLLAAVPLGLYAWRQSRNGGGHHH